MIRILFPRLVHARAFELHWPWWVTGSKIDVDEKSVCAAVKAENGDCAKNIVLSSYDARPYDVEWDFVEERGNGWSPFSGRFPRADWMQWD